VLGAGDPVARAASVRDSLRGQSAVTGVLLAVAGALASAGDRAPGRFLLPAVAVEIALLAGLALATTCVRERARDAIFAGRAGLPVAEIAAEQRRLASSPHRAALAGRLAAARYASRHWHETSISKRPPPSVCLLVDHEPLVAEIETLVCDPAPCLRGVALLDGLLRGGYTARLYTQPIAVVVRDLGRIRFLLAAGRDGATDGDPEAAV
jgi:hypothetical protein